MKFQKLLLGAVAALAALIGGCGGGGGGGADGGIGGTGVSSGTVTAFGSVVVNGVHFDVSKASATRDGVAIAAVDAVGALRVGMVARVDGSISGASANTVAVRSALKGRVEQVLDANRLLVMGQTVQIDTQSLTPTHFDGGVPGLDDYVEVHGLPLSGGAIAAGYIEKKVQPATTPFKVTGFVTAQNAGASTLTIGTLTVAYAGAVTSDMPSGSWVGQLVEAQGGTCATSPVCGTLTATQLEPAGLRVAQIAQAEVEGFVDTLSGSNFSIGGQPVVTNGATRYENGVAGDVLVGVKLEAEGSISGGVLTATKISFRDNVRLEGDVAAGSTGTNLTLDGLGGISVKVNALTDVRGGTPAVGDHVRIRGRAGAGNTVIATELDGRSSDTTVVLQGPVSALANPSLTILGVAVNTSGIAESPLANSGFSDLSGAKVSRSDFFGGLAVGKAVKAKGDLVGGSVVWSEMERED